MNETPMVGWLCKICGKPSGHRLYCGPDCLKIQQKQWNREYRLRNRTAPPKKCYQCQKEFPGDQRSNFCSTECRKSAQRSARPKSTSHQKSPNCIACGQPIPADKVGKFAHCSLACYEQARFERSKKYSERLGLPFRTRQCVHCGKVSHSTACSLSCLNQIKRMRFLVPDAFILENGGTDAETQAVFVLEQFLKIVDKLPGEVASLINLGIRPRPPAPAVKVVEEPPPAAG